MHCRQQFVELILTLRELIRRVVDVATEVAHVDAIHTGWGDLPLRVALVVSILRLRDAVVSVIHPALHEALAGVRHRLLDGLVLFLDNVIELTVQLILQAIADIKLVLFNLAGLPCLNQEQSLIEQLDVHIHLVTKRDQLRI